MKKVVVLGGGTGLSVLLAGLKQFPLNITAVVTVSDDGASSGKLRREFNMPAVGDLRNVLASFSSMDSLVADLLQYRFNTTSDLNNHAVGNLLLTALYDITGSLERALASLAKILNINGKVLPFTEDNAVLVARTNKGELLVGESKITKAFKVIDEIFYQDEVVVNSSVLKSIDEADLIIFGIGSLYTSIIPNVLNDKMIEHLKLSNAKKMYVSNIMTEHGETDGFFVSDCIKVINKYVQNKIIDVVISNSALIDDEIKKIYFSKEKSEPILIDEQELDKMGIEVIGDNLVKIDNLKIRHDSLKTAFLIFSYLMRNDI